MEVKREETTQEQWDEMKKVTQENVCAECGADLQVHTNPEKGTIEVGCLNLNHHGYVERLTYTQAFRRGEEVHPAIRDNIERKMMAKTELQRAMNLLALRFPRAIRDVPGAALFINDCMRLGLDPLIQPAEAVPVPFKTRDKSGREKTTVAMVVTEDGALSMAARGCREEYDGAPATMPLLDHLMQEHPQRPFEELKEMARRTAEELCDDPQAYVWVALGKRRSATGIQPVYGYFTTAERKKAQDNKLPAGTQPGNQARVRAVKRWVRENFPESRQKMIEYTAELYRRSEGAREAQDLIDAEYSFLSLPEGKKKAEATGEKVGAAAPAESPPDEAIEGEGFNIDLQWLKESQRTLKWTDDTTKTFLVSKYRVSPQGTLEDVIKRLTLEQVEDFVKEINTRLEKQTSLF
ncbi:hypothetical protein ES708_10376 [subsurface metagenome]